MLFASDSTSDDPVTGDSEVNREGISIRPPPQSNFGTTAFFLFLSIFANNLPQIKSAEASVIINPVEAALLNVAPQQAGEIVSDALRSRKNEESGRYFRHWTSFEGLKGIKKSRTIWEATRNDPTHGPGVYFTDPGISAKAVDASSGQTWIDVWISDRITNNEAFFKIRSPEYVYLGHEYAIDQKYPPIFGPKDK